MTCTIYLAGGSDDILEGDFDLQNHFLSLGKTNFTNIVYEGLDHHFEDQHGNSYKQQVFEDAVLWLKQVA